MTMTKLLLGAGYATALMLSATGAPATETVTWWYETATPDQQRALAETLIDRFNAAHPDYDLTIDYRGAEIDKQLRVALLSGSGPDIVYTAGPSYVATMAQAGQLLPLDDYAAELGWTDRLLPFFLRVGSYDGKLYSLPKTYETMGLFYDPAVFAEHGWQPPKTIAEMESLAEEMLAEGMTPLGAGNSTWRPSNEHYVSLALNSIAGPDNVYKALIGEKPWTDPEFVEAVEALDRWWKKGYFSENYFSLTNEQNIGLLAEGEAGMVPTGTWAFQWTPQYFTDGREVAFVAFPSGEGVDYPVYPLGIGSTFSINANAASPDGAAEAIDFIFGPEFYGPINARWSGEWNMPLRDLSDVDDTGIDPAYASAMATLAEAVDDNGYGYTTWTFWSPEAVQHIVNGIEEVWLDRATAEEYLAKLDEIHRADLEAGKVPATPPR